MRLSRNGAEAGYGRADGIQLGLSAAVAVLLIASACSSTPETPGNAVMAYLTAADLGKESEADGRLCERLKTEASDEELATLERVTNRASVFGEGTIRRTDDTAVVALEVLFAPSPEGADGEPWEAHLVKEDGTWKVCGFEPAG